MDQKPSDYYKSNLRLLKKYHYSIFVKITEDPPKPVGKISYAPNGNPNLTVTGSQGTSILLHNKTAPEIESTDFYKKVAENHQGFVAILGMGLCYATLKLFKKRPRLQRLAIFELDPGIFIQALKHMDLSPVLGDPRLILYIGSNADLPETLDKASRTIQLETSQILHHMPSFEYNLDGYNKLKDDLFSYINGLNIGGTTTRILGKDFLNNRFKHITTIHHHLLLEHLHNKFKNVPAILVAGGPSLDKNIHLLKQVQENAVIIAVDTTLPTLLENGVHPHFLTSIDPNDLTFEKFANIIPRVKDVALVCASWVNQKTPKNFPADQTFWTFTRKPIEAWLNSLFDGQVLTGGASTVAHLNLITADMLGCDPIIFIGQDLAFPNSASASHAQGTVLQGTAPPAQANTNTTEEETVVGINGEILRTNRSFLSMKVFFEKAIAKSDKIYINATEGGANIDGTQVWTLQNTIEQHCKTQINTTKKLKEFYSDIEPLNPDKMLSEFNRILIKTKQQQRTIKKADDITKSLLYVLLKLKKNGSHIKSFKMLSSQQQKQINKIDKLHANLDKTLEVWKLLEEITMEGLKTSERQKQEISILENDPEKYIEWLIKNLNRLIEINKVRKSTLTLLSDNLNMITSFHKKESQYIKQISADSQIELNKLKLARLYVKSKNYHLAKPVLEELNKTMPESGEVCFYLGCLSTQFNMLEDADNYFQTAIKYDAKLIPQIDSYKQDLGNTFLKFTRYFKTQPGRDISVKYMAQKGLNYDPDNKELANEMAIILKKDLIKIKSDIDSDNYQESNDLMDEWHQNAVKQKKIFDNFPAELVSNIFLYQGKFFLSRNDYQNTVTTLKQAMEYSPDNHIIHSSLIDTLFISGDFNNAIKALNKAITLDTKFAEYWETIGDSLQSADQNEDAILAYENCFTHLPDKINLLKKIGDCYMATDQLEAAKTAYQQLKIRMENVKAQ